MPSVPDNSDNVGRYSDVVCPMSIVYIYSSEEGSSRTRARVRVQFRAEARARSRVQARAKARDRAKRLR